jgi:hypothetical protein
MSRSQGESLRTRIIHAEQFGGGAILKIEIKYVEGWCRMANSWDDIMKMLVRSHPQDFVSFIFQGALYQGDITNELKVRSIEADFLCKAIRNDEEIVVHVEFQRHHDYAMRRRMWEYNCVTDYLTGLPVCSFVLYLRKDDYIVEPPYKRILSDGEVIHAFNYKNIFVWEVPPEELKRPGLEGMLPLLPLAKGADEARDSTVGDMIEGLRAAGKEDMLALGYAFAGLVYEKEDDRQWLKRRFAMFHDMLEESWSYREMVEKGLNKGIDIGIERGELKALRPVLIRFVETRFPELASLAQQQAERINRPESLSTVLDKLFLAQSTESARQILLDIDKTTDTPS